ncbi:DUF423 domain-containing protein [Mariniflexile ostreae]|uniref:DUF423 domain-containing protein n=1 Tax=Mariniflexile ostreae TaxID=1520892 RepID=A0ABV5F7P2_9FLAO
MTNKSLLVTASFLGLTSIILGAFGAHGLKALVSLEALQSFETGVKYQMYHALLLLFVGGTNLIPLKAKKIIFYLTLMGLLLFSGSIYGLATNELSGFDFKTIAFITPIGGLMLILAWVVLIVKFLKIK